jgi:hypothetical protein
MPTDDRDLLDVLRFELQFLEKGGYGRSPRQPWRAPLIFEDSPTCLNFALPEKVCPCSDCVLMQLVPEADREKSIPCDYIVLNEAGETIASLYRSADQPEIETVLKEWLRKTIREVEESRKNSPPVSAADAGVSSLNSAKCANPLCPTRFDAQSGGKFFVLRHLEGKAEESAQARHYWLCRDCSEVFTLVEQAGRGPVLAVRHRESHNGAAEKGGAQKGAAGQPAARHSR